MCSITYAPFAHRSVPAPSCCYAPGWGQLLWSLRWVSLCASALGEVLQAHDSDKAGSFPNLQTLPVGRDAELPAALLASLQAAANLESRLSDCVQPKGGKQQNNPAVDDPRRHIARRDYIWACLGCVPQAARHG